MAILIEHYAGKWPFWLNPKQAQICTISDNFNSYAEKVQKKLHYEGFRVSMDRGSATLQKKVRNAQLEQYNYILCVGAEEMNTNTVDVRSREGERIGKFTIEKLIDLFKSLEPKMSKAEQVIVEEIKNYESSVASDMDKYEERLKHDIYLGGDEISEEDTKVFESLKDQEINKNKHPNLFKWKKLVSKSFK